MSKSEKEVELITSLINIRNKICKVCPLNLNGICSTNLYLDPKTNKLSIKKKEGYCTGCGCLIEHKIKKSLGKCPCEKW